MPLPVGYKHTAETRAKMSRSRQGKPHSAEHKAAISSYWTPELRAQRAEQVRERYGLDQPAAERKRERRLRSRYGITAEEYLALLTEQGGVCAICHLAETHRHNVSGELTRLVVDHDHVTGAVRGLLCRACNLIVGNASDSPLRLREAAAYLEANQCASI